MTKGKAVVGLVLVLALAVGAARWGMFGDPEELGAKYPPLKWVLGEHVAKTQAFGPRPVSVEVATAVKRKTPVQIEALGNVTTMASVAVKPRIDDEIVGIHFGDGAFVKKDDLLVTLDPRTLQAQIAQAEAQIARDQAQLEMAERDLRRYTELVGKGATPQLNVDNARTAGDTLRASIRADKAAVDNLKVQLTFCFIRAPINGRISQASVKVGNLARSADTVPIATINQIAPIYVTFMVAQRNLPDIRVAMAEGEATVEALIPGETRTAVGRVSMIENTVDPTTGMATVRATMPNDGRALVARHPRQRASHPADRRGHRRALARRPGEPAGQLRLCGQGQCRLCDPGQGGQIARHRGGHRERAQRRRCRRHRRASPPDRQGARRRSRTQARGLT